jgi:hypothetical protein
MLAGLRTNETGERLSSTSATSLNSGFPSYYVLQKLIQGSALEHYVHPMYWQNFSWKKQANRFTQSFLP